MVNSRLFFVIIDIVGACVFEWSFKDLVCHFLCLETKKVTPPVKGSRARKKITNDADIFFKGVRDPRSGFKRNPIPA